MDGDCCTGSTCNSGSCGVAACTADADTLSVATETKLTASDGTANDNFGSTLAIEGTTMMVGAEDEGSNGSYGGEVYVFEHEGSSWSEVVALTPPVPADEAQFGFSVAISGTTLFVGAIEDDGPPGKVYVYDADGGSWSLSQTLVPSDGSNNDNFGRSIAVSGNRLIVASPADDDNGSFSGSAYIFDYNGSSWIQSAKLVPSDGAASDYLGYEKGVAISGDVAVVGAYRDDDDGTESGSAYIFRYDGTSWSQTEKLTANDAASSDRFGYSVAISCDTVVVGANQNDDNGTDSGSAYVYTE